MSDTKRGGAETRVLQWLERSKLEPDRGLEIILEALRELPSAQEFFRERGLMNPRDLIRVLAQQAESGQDFRAAAQTLNLWSTNHASGYEEYLQSIRLDLDALTPAHVPPTAVAAPASTPAVKKDSEAIWAPPEDPKVAHAASEADLSHFLEAFDTHRIGLLQDLSGRLKGHMRLSSEDRLARMREVYEQFHFIRGAARLSGATASETLLARAEHWLDGLMKSPESIGDTEWDEVAATTGRVAQTLWMSRENARVHGEELAWWLPAESKPSVLAPVGLTGQRRKILVIDDTRTVHRFVSDCLEGDFELINAYDGVEGLERLQEHPDVSLVLLDWEMPRMTGPEFMTKIAGMTSHPPIVMLTGRSDVDSIQSMLNLGVKEFVMKPFTQDILKQKIELAYELAEETSRAA